MSSGLGGNALGREYWDFWSYPRTLHNQKFGTSLDNADQLFEHRFRRMSGPSSLQRDFLANHSSLFRRELSSGGRASSPTSSSGTSTVHNDPSKFEVYLDVSQFNHDEIDVKTVDNEVVIRCAHQDKQDEHGFVKREFTRRYLLPVGADPEKVKCRLDSNGILAVSVPKNDEPKKDTNERLIPIEMSAKEKTAAAATTSAKKKTTSFAATTSKQSDV